MIHYTVGKMQNKIAVRISLQEYMTMFRSESQESTRLDPREFRRRALMISVVAVVLVYILWNVAALDAVMYPFRLFVTYVHESGHSLMAELTGGDIRGFTVNPDGTGVATTVGGTRELILPAGYLGAAFFGAVLFYLANTVRYARSISGVLGAGLIIFSILFARPATNGAPTALLVGIAFGAALMGIGWKANRTINMLLLNMLATMTSLHAVLDLYFLTRSADVRLEVPGGVDVRNDAAAFTELVTPFLPASIWAFIWAALAVIMLGVSVYYSIIRPLRKGQVWGREAR